MFPPTGDGSLNEVRDADRRWYLCSVRIFRERCAKNRQRIGTPPREVKNYRGDFEACPFGIRQRFKKMDCHRPRR
jgi:hypothetical protein